jgi:hypothetical protein
MGVYKYTEDLPEMDFDKEWTESMNGTHKKQETLLVCEGGERRAFSDMHAIKPSGLLLQKAYIGLEDSTHATQVLQRQCQIPGVSCT